MPTLINSEIPEIIVGYILYVSLYIIKNVYIKCRLFGFFAPTILNYLAFQFFDFECSLWTLFQKHVVRTTFDIYVFSGAQDAFPQ